MQVILNEQGYVEAYALIGEFASPSVTVPTPENIDDFEMNHRSYYLSNDNILVKSVDKQQDINEQRILTDLRFQRTKICFPYINRGSLWYETLSAEQKAELSEWYRAWLDVTNTKVVPEMPAWLS